MNRCVIIGGADIKNYEDVRSQFSIGDYFVFCDSGLKHAAALGVEPSLIVGDFDSYDAPKANGAELITLPREKDDTDTFFAAKEAQRLGFSEFLLVGVIGNRLDHTLGNISILVMLADAGAHAVAIDDYSEMEVLIGPSSISIGPEFSYFSIICLSDKLTGVSITGAKYPLSDATITPTYNFAISNEPLNNATVEVSTHRGIALVVRVR